jgi:hypothetical protein
MRMASSMVGTRLNEEVVEQLQKKADAEGKKVSDVVRELIISGLTQEKTKDQHAGVAGAGGKLMERLDQLDERLERALEKKAKEEQAPILQTNLGLEEMEKRLTKLLIKSVKAGAGSQFYARAGTLETVDLVSIWSAQIGAPENTEARKEVAGRLDADSQKFAEWWLKGG